MEGVFDKTQKEDTEYKGEVVGGGGCGVGRGNKWHRRGVTRGGDGRYGRHKR